MKEAVRQSVEKLPPNYQDVQADLLAAAERTSTLHSLLGYHPARGACRYNRENPLACETLIVDEASMVDSSLWRALLEALPEKAQLILLGDPNQLESVGEGAVLADLVEAARTITDLNRCWVHLQGSRRFRNRPDIDALAQAIVRREAKEVVKLLQSNRVGSASGGLKWIPEGKEGVTWNTLPVAIRDLLLHIAHETTPEKALSSIHKVSILSAHRNHSIGALGINRMVEKHLLDISEPTGRVLNTPIIINQNDPETRLRNGSVGILMTGDDGRRRAWFPNRRESDPPQSFPLGQLPDYSPAWALTIHRSQGSEYDHVLVILPKADSPLATRELLYTAITRARITVTIYSAIETVLKSIQSEHRLTGLKNHFF